uniref:Uncharacterized protein n=1 Tax=Cacopsylla melanoneura TaxID=428564 RepID=A0A8D8W9U5_9HEMI
MEQGAAAAVTYHATDARLHTVYLLFSFSIHILFMYHGSATAAAYRCSYRLVFMFPIDLVYNAQYIALSEYESASLSLENTKRFPFYRMEIPKKRRRRVSVSTTTDVREFF